MKINFFRLLLLTALMLTGGNVWGQTTLYERTATSWSSNDVGENGWSNGTIGSNGLEVTNGVASSLTITPAKSNSTLTWTSTWNPGNATGTADNTNAYISFGEVKFAFYGSSWKTKVTIGSETTQLSGVGTTRGRDYSISVTINQSTNEVSYSFTDNGNTVSGVGTLTNAASSYTLTHGLGGKSPNWVNTSTLKAVKITEEENTAQTANYTIKYFCNNVEIKNSVTRIGEVGSAITLQNSDTQTFYLNSNTEKYVYSSDDAADKVIKSDGSTVVSVYFTKISSFNYSIVNNFGTNIASGSVFEGETKTVCWPKYIQNDGEWYETASPYGVVISEATNMTVSYTKSDIAYCFEGENLTLSRSYGDVTGNVNYSNGDGYGVYQTAFLTTTQMTPAGSYVLTVNTQVRRNNDDVLTIQTSADGNEWTDCSSITLTSNVGGDFSTEITLENNSYLRLVNTGSNMYHYIDYLTLKQKVTAIPVTFTETNGVDAVISVDGVSATSETLFEVGDYAFTATADGYDDYEGTFSVSDDDLLNGSKTVSFTMSSSSDVTSVTVVYKYNNEEILSEPMDIADLTLTVGESFTVPFRMYVVKDGIIYQTRANNSNPFYGDNVELTKETVVEKSLSIVDMEGGSLAFFVDLDDTNGENAGIRASYCSAYNNKAYTSAETIPAGNYKFIIRKMDKGRGSKIVVGSTDVYVMDGVTNKNSWVNVMLDNVVIPEEGTLSLVKGTSAYDLYDIIIAIRKMDTETITVTSAGARTYCSKNVLDFSNVEGLKAYYLTVDGDQISMGDASLVGGYVGVYIEAAEGSYEVPVSNDLALEPLPPGVNDLVGVAEETQVEAPIYVLMNADNGLGFYKTSKTFTVGAHTAYIPGDKVNAGVKSLTFMNNEPTGISDVNADSQSVKNAVIYNLAGQRVAAPAKGIYIVNGKKVLFK
jgi:hypothetical protein